jgi:hypothetical protein
VNQDFEYLAIDDGRDPSDFWAENAFVEPRFFTYDDFNYTDRVHLFDYTIVYFPTWINLSQTGSEGKLQTLFVSLVLWPWTVIVGTAVLLLWPADLLHYFIRWVYGQPLSDMYPRFWSNFMSIWQALYWMFIAPIRPLVDFFILLPIDIALWSM